MGQRTDDEAILGEEGGPEPAAADDAPRLFLVGMAVVLATSTLVAALSASGLVDRGSADALSLAVSGAAVFAALGIFALCRARWRLVGESAPLWVGAAVLVYGLAVVALPRLIAPIGWPAGMGVALAMARAGAVVVPVAMAIGLFAPAVDARLTPGRLAVALGVAVAGLGGVFQLAPSAGRFLSIDSGVGAGAWAALATAYSVKSFRHRWLYGWCGVMMFALLMGGLASGLARSDSDPAWIGGGVLELEGLVLAQIGGALELGIAYRAQRSRLLDFEVSVATAAVNDRLRDASQRSRRHAVGNAVMAVEAAAVTLERHIDQLGSADREALTEALSLGVHRLERLMGEPAQDVVELAVAATQAVEEKGLGRQVAVDVPPGLVAHGDASKLAEVVGLLLENAERRAPGWPVTIEGEVSGTWAVLRVADRGPDVPRAQRRDLASLPDAIGVLVAVRLMAEQGGELWIEPREHGGSSFAVCLPKAEADHLGVSAVGA